MTTGTIAALKRADRALMGATLIATLGASAPAGYNLYTDEMRVATLASDARLPEALSAEDIAVQAAAEARQCLAEVLYYEARGEGETGEKAVAEVVMARLKSPDYPKTICGVVHEGADRPGKHCQFSFACDGSLKRTRDALAWERASTLAVSILGGAVKLGGQTGHAIAYHSASVTPDWADDMLKTAQIGNHIFYRRMPLSARLMTQAVAQGPAAPTAIASAETPLAADTRSNEIQPDIQGAGAVGDGT